MKHRFFVLSSSFFVCAISPAGVVAPAIGGLRITTPGANIKAAAKAARTPKMLCINAVPAEGSFGVRWLDTASLPARQCAKLMAVPAQLLAELVAG